MPIKVPFVSCSDFIKQIVDLTKEKTETKEQFTTEKTALLQRIEELERSATLDSTKEKTETKEQFTTELLF